MRFESPWAFLLLLAIPLTFWVRRRIAGRRGSLRFSSTEHARRLQWSWRQRLAGAPQLLRIVALIALVTALARPQQGKERVRDVSEGVAIEMVVDRSGSMGAEMEFDGQRMDRLKVVKQVFEEFVTGRGGDLPGRPNDLVGMVTFARYADTVCPLTLAHGALSEFLKSVRLVTRRNEDGTAIGDSLALAAARLNTAEETFARENGAGRKDFKIKSKVIILLTDGQNNAGRRTPQEAAELAKKWNIKVYAIGVGGEEGMMRQDSLFGDFLIRMGQGVDQQTLQAVAKTTGGAFYLAEDGESLRSIYGEIDRMERSRIESTRFLDYREMFLPLACSVLGLLCLETVLSCTVFRKIP